MHKAAWPSGSVDSSNPCCWRDGRLHHHGYGVYWISCVLWMVFCCQELILCKKWYKNIFKMRLPVLLSDPPTRTPSRVQTFFPKQESSWITQKRIWNGLTAPSHFVHLGVWIWKNPMRWKDMFHLQVEDKLFGENWLKCFATKILEAKYEKTDVAEVVKGLTHLNVHQKADLLWVLQENKRMFDGTLGVYSHKKVYIDIDPNVKPLHSRPYPVPQICLKTFKMEPDHLVRIGVLTPQ